VRTGVEIFIKTAFKGNQKNKKNNAKGMRQEFATFISLLVLYSMPLSNDFAII